MYVAWGSTYLAIRVMVEQMPPLLGSGTRALGACVLTEPVTTTTLLCAMVVVLGVAIVVASEGRDRVEAAQALKENYAR